VSPLICEKLDWDEANISHIARHDVLPPEVLQALLDAYSKHRTHSVHLGETRYTMLGRTDEGRLLMVVYTIRIGAIRPVTAYTASRKDERVYDSAR